MFDPVMKQLLPDKADDDRNTVWQTLVVTLVRLASVFLVLTRSIRKFLKYALLKKTLSTQYCKPTLQKYIFLNGSPRLIEGSWFINIVSTMYMYTRCLR